MPKMKTNQAAAKRFKKTKNGSFTRGKAGTRHLKTGKSAKRRRVLRQGDVLDKSEQARVKKLLPYA